MIISPLPVAAWLNVNLVVSKPRAMKRLIECDIYAHQRYLSPGPRW